MPDSISPLRGKDIRQRNENLIFGLIQKHGNLSQSEAVQLTGLKAPTILRIFANLENERFIKVNRNNQAAPDKKGRKPVFYKINKKTAYAVGVDFCSTSISIVIADLNRESVYNEFIDIEENHTGKSIVELLCQVIDHSITQSLIDRNKLLGIGVGAPGKVSICTGRVVSYDRIDGLADFPLSDRLADHFKLPVFVNNNCSVIAMNEYRSGLVSESKSLITLLIRSGVGGAYINEGHVLTTHGVTTMEVGHLTVSNEGRVCECGEKGCLQSYLAEPAILKDMKDIQPLDDFLTLDDLIDSDRENIDVFLHNKADKLCRGLKTMCRIFSPDAFLIISRSSRYAEKLAEYSEQIWAENPCRYDNLENLSFYHCVYNPVSAGLGAADMVFSDYFGN